MINIDKYTPVLLAAIVIALLTTAGCSVKEYPKDWPEQVTVSPSICPSLVGSYSNPAIKSDRYRDDVIIAMPTAGVLKYERHGTDNRIIQKEYSANDKTLTCSEKTALLDDGIRWDVYGAGLASMRILWTLSKDRDGFLIVERKDSVTFWFIVFFPILKYTENSWDRYAPVDGIVTINE